MRQNLEPKQTIRNPEQTLLRHQVNEHGWPGGPIPSDGKGYLPKGWPTMANKLREDVEKWNDSRFGMRPYKGTSMRVEADMLVLDIDVALPEVMKILLDRLWTRWPHWFGNALERNSGAVKVAFFGRISEAITATRTHKYGGGHMVEVHAGKTVRQMVIHGPHSSYDETGRVYDWVDGLAPWNTDYASMPVFPVEEIGDLVDLCDAVLGELLPRDVKSGPAEAEVVYDLEPDMQFIKTDGEQTTVGEVAESIEPGEDIRGILGDYADWTASQAKNHHGCMLSPNNRFYIRDFQDGVTHYFRTDEPAPPVEMDEATRDAIAHMGEDSGEEMSAPPERFGYTSVVGHSPTAKFIHRTTLELWPSATINARLPKVPTGEVDDNGKPKKIPASVYIMANNAVEQLSWVPGAPEFIMDAVILEGGQVPSKGKRVYNIYRAPPPCLGDARQAQRWIDHVERVYPGDVEHVIRFLAFTAQYPGIKINHGLLMGGAPGIGKDTILAPMRDAVGSWNCQDISPSNIGSEFNKWQRAVFLRINEMHDLGKETMYTLYERTKVLMAAPPEVLRINEKNMGEYYIPNVVKVVATTNYKENGVYLPAEDRRTYVAWSPLPAPDPNDPYFPAFYQWLDRQGGAAHVAAYLRTLDISAFDAKAPPLKTDAFWSIVNANRSTGDSGLEDLMVAMIERDGGRQPVILTIKDVQDFAFTSSMHDVANWIGDPKYKRHIPAALEKLGYMEVQNPHATDKRWRLNGRKQVVYRHNSASVRQAMDEIMVRNASNPLKGMIIPLRDDDK